MSQRNSTDRSGLRATVQSPFGYVLCLCASVLIFPGCATEGDPEEVAPGASFEAVEMWAHPDTVGIEVYAPLDFKAASRSVVWAIDRVARGVMRYKPAEGEHAAFGFLDNPPAEVVSPARLAIAENTGLFVFDDSTGMVDLYSPGGQHLRGFDPGLRPSILEISRKPLRLTYGVRAFEDDSIPTLSVIQTDFLGQNPDTLLSPGMGPETLREVPAISGNLVTTPSSSGLWVFARTATDTVFEVSGSGPSRKLVLSEADSLRAGILADLQQEILWVVEQQPFGGLGYEAYDISGQGDDGVIDGATAYLGFRTTPLHFVGRVAYDGSVSGWWRGERGVNSPRAFDMRIEDLRDGAESARASREARRAASAEEWVRIIQAVEEARLQDLEQTERVREEEGLEN